MRKSKAGRLQQSSTEPGSSPGDLHANAGPEKSAEEQEKLSSCTTATQHWVSSCHPRVGCAPRRAPAPAPTPCPPLSGHSGCPPSLLRPLSTAERSGLPPAPQPRRVSHVPSPPPCPPNIGPGQAPAPLRSGTPHAPQPRWVSPAPLRPLSTQLLSSTLHLTNSGPLPATQPSWVSPASCCPRSDPLLSCSGASRPAGCPPVSLLFGLCHLSPCAHSPSCLSAP